ncbi:MAG: aspartate-semialdehyde dehydrogenase [Rhodospirillaceae bacterium]|nr:aspartate-semialdehyde dehydrogenase [Rhodospirillaceae bacterium]MDG1274943.1 aspartate-semialdehyde dehydrogenase [Alphaproteobacteria bacterium]MDG1887857.1 aspartate-semialdehyde dehydrogenase [Alphaproteobacteria bacterium]|tara:strand:+ start:838 stop:1863 length:1026 start_codon:yes stop_codon:yes gene_type:complete
MSFKVAVVGATGAVGREMLQTLEERNFPIEEIVPLASEKSIGKEVSYGDKRILKVQNLETFDFTGTEIALFSAGSSIATKFAPKAAKQGAVVIDNSSRWRMETDVPLIVPEVNSDALGGYSKRNIIANPNCSTAQLVMALKPLHDVFKINRVVVSTYQSVSGAGSSGMDELFNQTRAVYVNDPVENHEFSKKIAFNCIPHIDTFMDDGFTKEEWKMTAETRKILDPAIDVVAHCVRVPVFIGHSEAVFIETKKPIDEQGARDVLSAFPGVIVVDHRESGGYVTPEECAGEDGVYISRLRRDPTVKNGLIFWCVADNLRKGAALNAVQIAEILIENHLKKAG